MRISGSGVTCVLPADLDAGVDTAGGDQLSVRGEAAGAAGALVRGHVAGLVGGRLGRHGRHVRLELQVQTRGERVLRLGALLVSLCAGGGGEGGQVCSGTQTGGDTPESTPGLTPDPDCIKLTAE